MKKLMELTIEQITEILVDTLDNGDWHTPSVTNVTLDNQYTSNACLCGSFNISKHNTYKNLQRFFEINEDAVRIWEERKSVNNRGDLVNERSYKPIYSLSKIVKKLNQIPDIKN